MPYKHYALTFEDNNVDPAVLVPDIQNANLDNNPEFDSIISAGQFSPSTQHLTTETFEQAFDTLAAGPALGLMGMRGICFNTTTPLSKPGLLMFLQLFDACGFPAATGHRSYQILAGTLFPRTLSCEHRGNASVSAQTTILNDGTNASVVISDTATLPIDPTGSNDRWTLGKMTVAGFDLPDGTNLEIDFGNTVTPRGVQSDIYDKYVEVKTHEPVIRLTGIDPTWIADTRIPVGGLPITHANTKIYLRKRAEGQSGFVPDGTAEHLSFTMAGLAVSAQMVSGDSTSFTETILELRGKKEGANEPLIYDGATAIT